MRWPRLALLRWPRLARPAVAASLAGMSVLCAVASVAVYAYNESHLGTRVQYLAEAVALARDVGLGSSGG